MTAVIQFFNKYKKQIKAIAVIAAAAVLYFVLCVTKMLPKNLNIISLLSKQETAQEQELVENNEFTPVGDKMYFQDTLIDSGVYLINGDLYVPVQVLCDVFGYEYEFGEEHSSVKTPSSEITLELYSEQYTADEKRMQLKHKIKANEQETYIAYDDISTVFAALRTVTLKSGKKCILDPVPYVRTGETFEKIYDKTLKEYIQQGQSITIEQFRQMYKIPAEISLDTDTNLFYSSISLSDFFGDGYEEARRQLIGSGVSAELFDSGLTYGEFLDNLTMAQVFGTNDISAQIKEYALESEFIGTDVTADTPYTEVRNIIALNRLDMRTEAELRAAREPSPSPSVTPSAEPSETPLPEPSETGVPSETTPPTDILPETPAQTIPPEKDPVENTVGAFARYLDMTAEEFLTELGLDPKTPEDTDMDELLDKITLEKQAKVFGGGMSVEKYAEYIGLPADKARPDMTMKEVAQLLSLTAQEEKAN